jgi:hypothetical protein
LRCQPTDADVAQIIYLDHCGTAAVGAWFVGPNYLYLIISNS